MHRSIVTLVVLAMMPVTLQASPQNTQPPQQPEKRSLRLLLEGDSSIAPYAFQELYKRGGERGCEISFASGVDDSYDARVILTTESVLVRFTNSMATVPTPTEWVAYGSAVVLMKDGKLLFTVSRSGQTESVIRNLLIRELIDDFQVYYPTLKRREPVPWTPSNVNAQEPSLREKRAERIPAGLPSEPGVYYKSPSGWTKLSEASVSKGQVSGAGKSLLAFGFANVRTSWVYRGGQSSTQIAEPTPTFLVRTVHAVIRDADMIRLQQKKDSRELPITTMNASGSKYVGDDSIAARAVVDLVTDDVFILRPRTPLKPGEYLLHLVGSDESGGGHEFGITAPRK